VQNTLEMLGLEGWVLVLVALAWELVLVLVPVLVALVLGLVLVLAAMVDHHR